VSHAALGRRSDGIGCVGVYSEAAGISATSLGVSRVKGKRDPIEIWRLDAG